MAVSATRTTVRVVRSTARTDLDETHKRLRQAKEAAAAARHPLDRANDQLEHAQQSERSAQAGVVAVDAQEAALVGESWPPQAPSPKLKQARRDAEDNLAAARRTLTTVQDNVAAARGPAEQAAAKVAEIGNELESAICAVLIEEGQAALARLVEARRHAIAVEGAVRAIALTMANKQFFRGAEQISTALYEISRPEATVDTLPYLKLVERLTVDADAEF
jgi:hypothetical protein